MLSTMTCFIFKSVKYYYENLQTLGHKAFCFQASVTCSLASTGPIALSCFQDLHV